MASALPLHFTCSGEKNATLLIVLHMNKGQFSETAKVMKIPLWSCFFFHTLNHKICVVRFHRSCHRFWWYDEKECRSCSSPACHNTKMCETKVKGLIPYLFKAMFYSSRCWSIFYSEI